MIVSVDFCETSVLCRLCNEQIEHACEEHSYKSFKEEPGGGPGQAVAIAQGSDWMEWLKELARCEMSDEDGPFYGHACEALGFINFLIKENGRHIKTIWDVGAPVPGIPPNEVVEYIRARHPDVFKRHRSG